jgi:hypothetical protein
MTTNDPLLDLVVDASEVDRERIAQALRGIIAIDKSGQVIPAQGFSKLTASQRILAFLLGRKVAVLLGMAEIEAIGPTALASRSGMAEGTVYPTVRTLQKSRLVSQEEDGAYVLSPHQVGTAIDYLIQPIDETNRNPKPQQRARAAKKAPKAAKTAKTAKARPRTAQDSDSEASDVPSKRQRRQAPGFSPTETLRDLVDQGYFDSPKTLKQVQAWFKDKQGRDVPVTSLSTLFTRLLRRGLLDRTKSDDGTYEYVSARD